ncbi:methyltransferase domain-containing protein [Tumebacillus sp. ITR2]|uniref:Methyltransferase domain-containing protein n=1 Tax=Tumebacillus amylolyticus TaxID=2801339 RepID=A0ABS1JCU6_9BACL|nr:methyltransferase domain-containing protein [Tumebacillus amylolyticus]MBL0388068.1 methyltransferase domain-containing protein [Tumebacillus amylolyticus]
MEGQDDVKHQVKEYFSKTAENYLVKGEVKEPDLLHMLQTISFTGQERMLDIGTATGRTLMTFAPHIREGIGLDLTPAMLAIAEREAKAAGLTHLSWQEGDVENLPFADGSFDLITARICAHHFPNVQRAVEEMARVLKPGGRLMIVDNYAPEHDGGDVFINAIEILRDNSHVREWRLSEWKSFYEKAGLSFVVDFEYRTFHPLGAWTRKSQTPSDVVAQIEQDIIAAASDESIRDIFNLKQNQQGEWSFDLLKALMVGVKRESP